MSVVAPPKEDRPSRVITRIITLVVMVAVVGITIWAAVTNQNVGLVETVDQTTMDLASPAVVDGDRINVVHYGLGRPHIVLLHDVDVAGSVLWDGVIDELGLEVTTITIDLPGYGLSARYPETGVAHTVASMAQVVGEIVGDRLPNRPVTIAGVGLGAEVAAEIAVSKPDLIRALVMIDPDFYASDGFIRSLEQWPFIGPAATYAFHGGGAWYDRFWSPHCEDGGWCPSRGQIAARDLATTIVGTNDSLRAFWLTPASSLVPSLLDEIDVPTKLLWSASGPVPRDSIDRVIAAMPGLDLVEINAWKAHLDAPAVVAEEILAIATGS